MHGGFYDHDNHIFVLNGLEKKVLSNICTVFTLPLPYPLPFPLRFTIDNGFRYYNSVISVIIIPSIRTLANLYIIITHQFLVMNFVNTVLHT